MDDTISRQEAIKEVRELAFSLYGYDATNVISCAINRLQNLPSAQRKGKWIDAWRSALDGTRHWHRECSECGYERDDDNIDKDTNFCPNCGAEMMKGEEDE